jgi:signal transduction histidine kinase
MNDLKGLSNGVFISIRWKMIFILTIVFSVLFYIVYTLFYRVSTELALDNLYAELISVARNAADGIDGDLHQALYDDPEYDASQDWPKGMTDERYWQIAGWLNSFHISNPRAYLYTYVSPEPGTVEFVVSMGVFVEPIIGAEFGELYTPQPPSVILEGLTKETRSEKVVNDKWGSWVSGFVPIYDSSGQVVAAVGVDYMANNLIEIQNRLRQSFLPYFVGSYLILLVLVILISNQMMAPLVSLAESAKKIGDGQDFDERGRSSAFQDELTVLEAVIFDMGCKVRTREEELKSLSEQLHYFYQASITYREKENTDLALNIHDEILSLLAVMSMEDAILGNPEFNTQFQELTNRVRNMMSSLRPVMLNYGLWLALEEYVEECSSRVGLNANLQLDLPFCDSRFDVKVEEHIFRIVQQASENAIRHASASSIRIDGEINHKQIEIMVEDDGDGFRIERLDFASLLNKGHFGLASMFERASLIGSRLEIDTSLGHGTRVEICWEEPDIGNQP